MASKNENVPGFNGPVITTGQAHYLVDDMTDLL